MTKEIPTLTFADAVKAARKAFDEKRLGAQRGHAHCMYDYGDGAVCAIGASFVPSDTTLNQVDVGSLVTEKVLTVTDSDLPLLQLLQLIHDEWASHDGGAAWEPLDTHEWASQWGATWDPLDKHGWAKDWAMAHMDHPINEDLFESFLGTAERELALA